jgi:hypothetical protein
MNSIRNISPPPPSLQSSSSNGGEWNKNILIIVLIVVLLLSFLGINILNLTGSILENIVNIFKPLFSSILYTLGILVDKSSETVAGGAKIGIDVVDGVGHTVGNLLINASQNDILPNMKQQLDTAIQNAKNGGGSTIPITADTTASSIQTPISVKKTSNAWCLVGEYEGKRGCVSVEDSTKCLSGQVFPSQQLCVNPALTNPSHPLQSVPE